MHKSHLGHWIMNSQIFLLREAVGMEGNPSVPISRGMLNRRLECLIQKKTHTLENKITKSWTISVFGRFSISEMCLQWRPDATYFIRPKCLRLYKNCTTINCTLIKKIRNHILLLFVFLQYKVLILKAKLTISWIYQQV